MVDLSLINDAILGAFAETTPATITRVADPDVDEVEGIFDSRHFVIAEGEVGVSALVTTLAVRSSVDAPKGSGVLVRGVQYRVKDIRPDAEGWQVLELERAQTD